MTWEVTRHQLLEAFFDKMGALGRQIDVSEKLLPKLSDDGGYDCKWVDIEGPNPAYCFFYRERDDIRLLKRSFDAQEVMEAIFQGITQDKATSHELRHRISGRDSRRQWFPMQVELMTRLDARWGENQARRQAEILAENPFMDDLA